MCTKFILTENLWAGRLLIGAENSHLWFTNVLKIRDTEYLRSSLVSSPTIIHGTIPDRMLWLSLWNKAITKLLGVFLSLTVSLVYWDLLQ